MGAPSRRYQVACGTGFATPGHSSRADDPGVTETFDGLLKVNGADRGVYSTWIVVFSGSLSSVPVIELTAEQR